MKEFDEEEFDKGKDSTHAPEIKILTDEEEMAQLRNTLKLLKLKVCVNYPYFATYIYSAIQYVVSEDLPTFAVDEKLRFFYNPGMFDVCTMAELTGAFVHEIHHIIKNDCTRGKGYEHHYYVNIAQDLVINQHVVKDNIKKVELPKFAVFPHTPGIELPPNQTFEWYYHELVKKAKKKKKEEGNEGEEASPSGGSCGSVAGGGAKKKWEKGSSANGEPLPEGRSDIQKEYYKKITAEAIRQRANSSNPGDIPGDLLRWAEEILNPKIDWKKELRSMVRNEISRVSSGLSDYTYRRMSRRQGTAQIRRVILPGFQTFDPTIAIIMDTSGSMDESLISQAIAETTSVIKNTNASVIFVACDAAVYSIGPVRNKTDLKKRIGGGGGTDMRVAYKALEEYKSKPNLIICLTDGYTPWPDKPNKGTKNIICITLPKNTKGYGDCPSWAKVIHAETD